MEAQEIITAEAGTVALLNKSEIDMQVATAHKYPRSVKRFRDETLAMVTLNENVAQECIYSLPRDGKNIEGPSARFAEVVASAWGNSRAGARVVSDVGDFVTAQGVFHDLERNVAITYEVQRRIVDKHGNRFKPDMIGVTANAACSIALRNAILKGVPKAFWSDLYDSARQTAIGNVQTLANRRARALAVLQKYGVTREQVLDFLQVAGEEDITLDHLATLFGITTALKDGDTTPEQAFNIESKSRPAAAAPAAPAFYDQTKFDGNFAKWAETIATGRKTAADYINFASTRGEPFTEDQKARLLSVKKAPAADVQDVQDVQPKEPPADEVPAVSYAEVAGKLRGAQDMDALDEAASLIGAVSNPEHRTELAGIYDECARALGGE